MSRVFVISRNTADCHVAIRATVGIEDDPFPGNRAGDKQHSLRHQVTARQGPLLPSERSKRIFRVVRFPKSPAHPVALQRA
jgi:hypothetical protein